MQVLCGVVGNDVVGKLKGKFMPKTPEEVLMLLLMDLKCYENGGVVRCNGSHYLHGMSLLQLCENVGDVKVVKFDVCDGLSNFDLVLKWVCGLYVVTYDQRYWYHNRKMCDENYSLCVESLGFEDSLRQMYGLLDGKMPKVIGECDEYDVFPTDEFEMFYELISDMRGVKGRNNRFERKKLYGEYDVGVYVLPDLFVYPLKNLMLVFFEAKHGNGRGDWGEFKVVFEWDYDDCTRVVYEQNDYMCEYHHTCSHKVSCVPKVSQSS